MACNNIRYSYVFILALFMIDAFSSLKLSDSTTNNFQNNTRLFTVSVDASSPFKFYIKESESLSVYDDSVVWARITESYKSTGWSSLEISTTRRPDYSHEFLAKAAGFAEGFIQSSQIYDYWTNYRANEYKNSGGQPPKKLEMWAENQREFVTNMSKTSNTAFWNMMELVLAQFDGFCHGFWAATVDTSKNLTYTDLYLLQSLGDLYDLNVILPGHETNEAIQPTPGHGALGFDGYGGMLECSAIIKLTNLRESRHKSMSDAVSFIPTFLAGHTTWRRYYAMIRTWKIYDFPWIIGGPLQVSSSPGLLHSKDDWYTKDGLLIMETTNGIYNTSIYGAITANSALSWQRAQVANFAARSGEEWVSLFEQENSGTYNNQWMVLNVDLLEDGEDHDVLWILEQLPGLVRKADVTDVLLDSGYWPSYNVPYFKDIYDAAGYPQPSIYSTCPRARIFKREQPNLRTEEDLRRLIRYNRYETDPLSEGLPYNAIAARYDLPPLSPPSNLTSPRASSVPSSNQRLSKTGNQKLTSKISRKDVSQPQEDGALNQGLTASDSEWHPLPTGAVDAKVTSSALFRAGKTSIVNGPTSDNLPVFCWSDVPAFENVTRLGIVDCYDFPWLVMEGTLHSSLRALYGA